MIDTIKFIALIMMAGPAVLHSDQPILYFDLNESRTTYENKGISQERLRGAGPKQRAGKAGSGVSGKKTDRAWDATANKGCGAKDPENDSKLTTTGPVPEMDSLKAFTMMMWYTSEQNMGDALRLIYKANTHNWRKLDKGFMLRSFTSENVKGKLALRLTLGTGGARSEFSSNFYDERKGFNVYGPDNKWIFLAITWDGEHVQFYCGGKESSVEPASYPMRFKGKMMPSANQLFIGNSNNRGLDGKIDNIRFYDVALSAGQLEEIRSKDVEG